MMKNIAIVGAGQSGLQLAFELLHQSDYTVTLYTDQGADEVMTSAAPPVPIQFTPSLQYEKELGLDFWSSEPPTHVDGVRFQLFLPDGAKAMTIEAPLEVKAQTVDLRLKFSVWLREFEKRGGKLVITTLSVNLLEHLAVDHDAVFVATKKADLTSVFERDEEKSKYQRPQRQVALFYVRGAKLNYQDDPSSGGSSYNILQGAGELIMSPFLSKEKERIFYLLCEAIPGGPMDFFDATQEAAAQLARIKAFVQSSYPEVYGMMEDLTLYGPEEWVCGAVTPYVRKPVGTLPSGRIVMPIGDTLILNDPIMAQGLNGASKMARHIAQCITPEATFTPAWINEVFGRYWKTAQYNNEVTYSMLEGPQPHQQQILFAASQNPAVARDLVNGIGDAVSMYPWYGDADEAEKYLEEKEALVAS